MHSMEAVAESNGFSHILEAVRQKGGKLWSEKGQLRYVAPKGALTESELNELRLRKREILTFLEKSGAAKPAATEGKAASADGSYPLTFSQLAHWTLHRMGERRVFRQIAAAARLQGSLNIEVLQRSLQEIVRRHDALRVRIVVESGTPVQTVGPSDDRGLLVDDLTALPKGAREAQVQRLAEEFIFQPIDAAKDPLFGLKLFRLGEHEHVLVLAMQHIISDMFSTTILLREALTAYRQIMAGSPPSLPEIPLQFTSFARQQRAEEKEWVEKHSGHWAALCANAERLRFPAEPGYQSSAKLRWGTISLRIDRDTKAELLEWSRIRQTTLPMTVFTAYAATVFRWCDTRGAVLRYITDGRMSAEVQNTIGFFASILYPHLELHESDTFVELLRRVMREYCLAYDHADAFYLSTREPQPAFVSNPSFNWVPQGATADVSSSEGRQEGIACSTKPLAHVMLKRLEWDQEPGLLLYDTSDAVVGELYFQENRYSQMTMQRFVRNFHMVTDELLRRPNQRVLDIALCR